MTLAERLRELVRAAFSGIYVHSFEHQDAIQELAQLCRQEGWSLATWDVDRGLALAGPATDATAAVQAADPLAAIRSLGALATPEGTALLVLRNFHRFLNSAEVVQALDTQIHRGKQARTFVVILAPVVQIPVELEKQLVLVDHDLPDRGQLEAIARSLATEPGELPEGTAWTPSSTRRGPDAHGGRERPEPRPGPPRAAGARRPLGHQGGRSRSPACWTCTGAARRSPTWAAWRRSRRSAPAPCARGGSPTARPRGVLLLGVPGTASRSSPRRWATRRAARRWSWTSGR
jgi:hypothetical protein